MRMTLTLVDLADAVALLFKGAHIFQTNVFGPQVRRVVSRALDNRSSVAVGPAPPR
jgi:hypothetical protein